VTDVQMVNTSGITTFDAEAIRIAWEAGPKEPVPTSMLSPNDRAYLHWSFWRDQRQCGTFGVEVYVLDDQGRRNEIDMDRNKLEAEEARIGVRNQGAGQTPANGGVAPVLGAPEDNRKGDDGSDAGDGASPDKAKPIERKGS